jgi:hypothetical protein
MTLEPIVHEYALTCDPAKAFDVYVQRIGEWWHPKFSANPETFRNVTIEAGVGGRVYLTHADLGELDWGRVTAWESGHRLTHTSTLAQTREYPSEITVRFTPSAEGCTMRFEHGAWNEGNAADRAKFSEWTVMLDRFAALANG